MPDEAKTCVACAEQIKQGASLCPFCETRQDDPRFARPETDAGVAKDASEDADKRDSVQLIALLEKQIQATNRVNHAVRAIVIPSTIVLVGLLFATPFLIAGLISGEAGVLVVAGIIILAGGVGAIISQITESRLSDIPSDMLARSSDTDIHGALVSVASDAKPTEVGDADVRKCSSCGAKYSRNRMACPDCGMN